MATLGNILARQGGTPLTGRPVRLTLAISDAAGNVSAEQVEAVLLPVSLSRRMRAFNDAEEYVAKCQKEADEARAEGQPVPNPVPSLTDERGFRFALAALRDAEKHGREFVEEKYIPAMRKALVDEQVRYLLSEYDDLIRAEYAEISSWEEAQRIKQQAHATFPSGPA